MEYAKNKEYKLKTIEGKELVTYRGKIYIPTSLRTRIMYWYHTYLLHPGATRMLNTINATMFWHGMRVHVDNYVKTCHICQLTKKQQKKYGHLAPKKAEVTPWKRVNVILIGPYTIQTKKNTYSLRAMTMIDLATTVNCVS